MIFAGVWASRAPCGGAYRVPARSKPAFAFSRFGETRPDRGIPQRRKTLSVGSRLPDAEKRETRFFIGLLVAGSINVVFAQK